MRMLRSGIKTIAWWRKTVQQRAMAMTKARAGCCWIAGALLLEGMRWRHHPVTCRSQAHDVVVVVIHVCRVVVHKAAGRCERSSANVTATASSSC